MDLRDGVDGARTNLNTDEEQRTEPPAVSALRSSPDRVVFTEDGNSDGWISVSAELTSPIER
ncbi:hypothetical protein [Halobellus rarus]|uniref:Uncharacterized protein n=1 Tax=Halobellus rarus TaxID=1126237 RepID=A0ABD6CU72_9EURY|nr:hypothetical protein [Halobellus rarus]